MALSETLARPLQRIERIRMRLRHHEKTQEQQARNAIRFTVESIQHGKLDAARLMREIDGEDSCIIFTAPEVRLPSGIAYGILDLTGRMGNHHSAPVELGQNHKVFTHPSVLKTSNNVVFDAVEEFDSDGKRRFVDVWAKRRTPAHNKLFPTVGNRIRESQSLFGNPPNPAETIDAKNGVY